MLNIIESLSTGAALLLAFLCLLNINKRNVKANQWLGIFLIAVFLLFLDDLFLNENIYNQYPHLYGFVPVCLLFVIPSLFLSITFFTSPDKKVEFKDGLHFLPIVFYLIGNASFYFSSGDEKRMFLQNDSFGNDDVTTASIFCFFIQSILYGFFSLKKLYQHRKNSVLFTANSEEIRLDWLTRFVVIFFLMVGLFIFKTIYQNELVEALFTIAFFMGVFLLSYFSLKQKETFPINEAERNEITEVISQTQKESKKKTSTLLNATELLSLGNRLDEIMTSQKPYLDNELNLPKLAQLLDIPSYKLSHLLNKHYGENFSSFINKKRVERAKELLADSKYLHFNAIQIAYEAGFNSKTIFNTRFKKITGLTPLAYRKQFS